MTGYIKRILSYRPSPRKYAKDYAINLFTFYKTKWTKRAFLLALITFFSLPTLGAHIVDNFGIRPTLGNWMGAVIGAWIEAWILLTSKDQEQMDTRIKNYALFAGAIFAVNMIVLWVIAILRSHVLIGTGYGW